MDEKGNEVWRYNGREIERRQNYIVLEALFTRPNINLQGMTIQQGDRFVETYYTDRWYNIFEIHDHQDDHLRGWYINIGYPAVIDGDIISYRDLALDVLVFPDGRQIVLDEDEFIALDLSPEVRQKALTTLNELIHSHSQPRSISTAG